jgi:hypothetical protein
MSEKPQKRLVGWKQYLSILGKKGLTYGWATMCIIAGCLLLLGVASACLWILFDGVSESSLFTLLALIGALVGFSIQTLRAGKSLYVRARNMETVTLLTRHNTADLPAIETLVRASDAPTSQQAELLRAAQYGKETPAEELLRAIAKRTSD